MVSVDGVAISCGAQLGESVGSARTFARFPPHFVGHRQLPQGEDTLQFWAQSVCARCCPGQLTLVGLRLEHRSTLLHSASFIGGVHEDQPHNRHVPRVRMSSTAE